MTMSLKAMSWAEFWMRLYTGNENGEVGGKSSEVKLCLKGRRRRNLRTLAQKIFGIQSRDLQRSFARA